MTHISIGIVDYGLGNRASVAGAVSACEATPVVTSDATTLAACDKLVLPGVGAFGDGMRNLRERGLVDVLNDLVMRDGKPLLGICLGFQLMAKDSDEFGHHDGLGWIDARVRKFALDPSAWRVPHVGWNETHQRGDGVLFRDVPDGALFYFVHSHRMQCDDDSLVVGECDYGERFVAAVQHGPVHGTQFHPEKSQLHGLTVLRNFIAHA